MFLKGIGTDLVSIERIRRIWARYGMAFARRILAEAEALELSQLSLAPYADPAAFLAKRFAAKEAAVKALGTGFRANGLWLKDIAVAHRQSGQPYLVWSPRAQVLLNQQSIHESHLSLSDEQAYALAFVILLGNHPM